jgi:arylsulfatase A
MKSPASIVAGLLGLIIALPVACAAADTQPGKPNIIFILADDLGIANVSAYGADNFKTPSLDALARSGIRLDRTFSCPNCGPSRAALLTGRYGFHTGMTGNDKESQKVIESGGEIMIPKILNPAGYVTGAVGKWSQVPLSPGDWGFDEYLMIQGSGKYWNSQDNGDSYTVNGKKVPLLGGEYLPDKMNEFAVDFITRHKDQPFFLYYPMSHVHNEILRTPDSAPDSKDLFTDNVVYMDKLVGKLMAELDRLNLRENTIVYFVGDNGVTPGQSDRSTIGGKRLSGSKGTLLEGASLVPCIVSWPGKIPAGTTTTGLVDFTDFLPSIAEAAGADIPDGLAIDGKSFWNHLLGYAAAPREWIFVGLGRNWYVREARWKLTDKGDFFDMKGAPFIESPVAADTTDVAAIAGRQRLAAVLAELNPAAGKVNHGDGTGKFPAAQKAAKKEKAKQKKAEAEAAAKKSAGPVQ